MKQDIVLLEGARTALAEFCGSFRDVPATDLGAYASVEAIKRSNIAPEEIDHVVFGNVQQSSKDAHFLARHVGLKAKVPIEVPAVTINRLCGTGIEVILTAARFIQTGEANVVLAGGAENMGQVHVHSGECVGAQNWIARSLKIGYGMDYMTHTANVPWRSLRKI